MIKVSVIVPMYKARRVIEPCVNALLRQDLEDMEIILVDDCSCDGTYEYALERFQGNEKIRVLCMDQNGGPGLARNRGIEEAKGEYICFCDADDCYRDGARGGCPFSRGCLCDHGELSDVGRVFA